MEFRVDLDVFRGPLDLLLYLVRKHEVDVADVAIGRVTEQYLEHLEVLQELNVDEVGDFIELASTLVEIKSRSVLPAAEEAEEQLDDPREELVQRLLEYKRYRDAASVLDERSRRWQQRFNRVAKDQPPRPVDLGTQSVQQIELWDLVSAFGRVLRDHQVEESSNIVYDETPIHVYMEQIRDRLRESGPVRISELFSPGMHKAAMIGVFLAVLELVRHHSIDTVQDDAHGEINILPGERLHEDIQLDSDFESATPSEQGGQRKGEDGDAGESEGESESEGGRG